MGISKNGWFVRENAIKMDDLGVPLFQETTIYILIICVHFRVSLFQGSWGQRSSCYLG